MHKILGSSKVSPRFQITISQEVRKTIEIKSGMTVVFAQDENGKIYLLTEL